MKKVFILFIFFCFLFSTCKNPTVIVNEPDEDSYTIVASSDEGGNISPEGEVIVVPGISQTFTISSNTGFRILSILVDDIDLGNIVSYTFDNIMSSHTITAKFIEFNGILINSSCSEGGSISPSGEVIIENYGDNEVFTITPNSGYEISSVLVDGVDQGPISSYTFTNIIDYHSISATYKSLLPSNPQNFLASENLEEIYYSWDSSDLADGYILECSLSQDFSSIAFEVDLDSNIHELTKTGLTTGNTYYSRIKSYNSYGDSSWTLIDVGITIPAPMSGSIWTSNTANGEPILITDESLYFVSNVNNAVDMRVGMYGSWADWFDYTESFDPEFDPWDLEEIEYNFDFQFRDKYGNILSSSTSFTYDSTAPTGSFNAAIISGTNTVQITCSPNEDLSSIDFGFYKDGEFGLIGNQSYQESFTVDMNDGSGDYIVVMRFIDIAGNEGSYIEKTISYVP